MQTTGAKGDAAHHRHLARRRDGDEHAAVLRPGALQQRAVLRPTTSYVLLKPLAVGFPSSDTVTFTLDPTGLTSAYGDPMVGPSRISVAPARSRRRSGCPGADGSDGGGHASRRAICCRSLFSNRVAGPATHRAVRPRRARTAPRCRSRWRPTPAIRPSSISRPRAASAAGRRRADRGDDRRRRPRRVRRADGRRRPHHASRPARPPRRARRRLSRSPLPTPRPTI